MNETAILHASSPPGDANGAVANPSPTISDPMKQVPLEIITMFVEALEEKGPTCYDLSDCYISWPVMTPESQKDICNMRLVCHKFNNGCFKSFGKLLGDRLFRFTPSGMSKLTCMGALPSLTPYVQTLTFGTAEFDQEGIDRLRIICEQLHDSDRQRLVGAYKTSYDRQLAIRQDLTDRLSTCFRAFPNLRDLRIVYDDQPGFVGGWLGDGDREKISGAFEDRDPSLIMSPERGLLGLHGATTAAAAIPCLFSAFQSVNIKIMKLQIQYDSEHGNQLEPSLNANHEIFSRLRTLALTVFDFGTFDRLATFLERATTLEDISLIVKNDPYPIYDDDFDEHVQAQEGISTTLFTALSLHVSLRHVILEGDWVFSKQSLVEFITTHRTSLRSLILYQPNLISGTWMAALQETARLTMDKMKHLKLIYPAQFDEMEDSMLYLGGPIIIPTFTFPVEILYSRH